MLCNLKLEGCNIRRLEGWLQGQMTVYNPDKPSLFCKIAKYESTLIVSESPESLCCMKAKHFWIRQIKILPLSSPSLIQAVKSTVRSPKQLTCPLAPCSDTSGGLLEGSLVISWLPDLPFGWHMSISSAIGSWGINRGIENRFGRVVNYGNLRHCVYPCSTASTQLNGMCPEATNVQSGQVNWQDSRGKEGWDKANVSLMCYKFN